MHMYPRYERHAELVGIGEKGQQKLFETKLLIIGAGGLGCPALLYLAAAGVGHITIADDDTVSLSNLQRQILYGVKDIGQPKVETSRDKIRLMNPEIDVVSLAVRVDDKSISGLIDAHARIDIDVTSGG